MTQPEMITAMVEEYRQELEALSLVELQMQWDAMKAVKRMRDDQWEVVRQVLDRRGKE